MVGTNPSHGILLSFDIGLIIYHCTFLSLRSHDSTRHVRNYLDYDLAGEKLYFSGFVLPLCPGICANEDQRNSRQRIQACTSSLSRSKHRCAPFGGFGFKGRNGEVRTHSCMDFDTFLINLRSTPIWTAFITHCITSPTWCRYTENSSTVYLADLRRHVFSSEYTPHVAANGEHFLDFELVQGRYHTHDCRVSFRG